MPLYVARRKPRVGLYLPMAGTKENPGLIFFLPKMALGQLDEFVRKELAKQGITEESKVQAIIAEAEKEYEKKIKVSETIRELRRLMKIKAAGGKLMSVGHRKWRQAFYRPIKKEE